MWFELGAPISHEVEEWSKSRSIILQRFLPAGPTFFSTDPWVLSFSVHLLLTDFNIAIENDHS